MRSSWILVALLLVPASVGGQGPSCPAPAAPACPPIASGTDLESCLAPDAPCDCPFPPTATCVGAVVSALSPPARRVDHLLPGFPFAGALIWSPSPGPDTKYLVTLPGTGGTAETELYHWQRLVDELSTCLARDIGVMAVEYENPATGRSLLWGDLNLLIEALLAGEASVGLGAETGHAFHGFSRGAADLYGVAVLDGKDGLRRGTRFIANSGAWRPGTPMPEPLSEELVSGSRTALYGVEFLVHYGLQDHDQGQHGYVGSSGAARAVRKLGGEVELWVDPDGCHHAFELTDRPGHAWDALQWAFR